MYLALIYYLKNINIFDIKKKEKMLNEPEKTVKKNIKKFKN